MMQMRGIILKGYRQKRAVLMISMLLTICVLVGCGVGGSTHSKAFQDESSAQEFLLNALFERYGQEFQILDRTHYSSYIIGDVYTAEVCPVSDCEQIADCRVVDDGTVEDSYAIYFFGQQAEEMAVSALGSNSAVAGMTFSYSAAGTETVWKPEDSFEDYMSQEKFYLRINLELTPGMSREEYAQFLLDVLPLIYAFPFNTDLDVRLDGETVFFRNITSGDTRNDNLERILEEMEIIGGEENERSKT